MNSPPIDIPLNELVEVNPRDFPAGNSVPYVGMEDVSEDGRLLRIGSRARDAISPGQPAFSDGDVLFAKITPCMENGKGALVSGLGGRVAQGSTEFHVLRVRQAVDPRFIYQWTRTPALRRAAAAMMTGSAGQRRVPPAFFAKFKVPSFEFEEQRRIAEILDALDFLLTKQEAINSKLDALRSGLTESLLEHLYVAEQSPLGEVFAVKSGITLGPERAPALRPRSYLRVANVQRASIELSELTQMECSATEESVYGLAEGDLLVVEGHANPEEIGRCAMVNRNAADLLYQNHLFRLRAESIISKFGEIWLNSSFVRAYWRRMCATSSGLYTINSKMLKKLMVPSIGIEDQSQIVRPVVAIEERIDRERSYAERLKLLKQGLAEDLLTGRVRVPEAEAVVESL